MFFNNQKILWDAMLNRVWHPYFMDNWKVAIKKWGGSLYYPFWIVYIKLKDWTVKKINHKGTVISELDDINLFNPNKDDEL